MLDVRDVPGGARLSVRCQPRAAKNEVAGVSGRALRLRLTAPPVDGAANQACVEVLAAALGVARRQVRIVAGARSRDKVVEVEGLSAAAVAERLGRLSLEADQD